MLATGTNYAKEEILNWIELCVRSAWDWAIAFDSIQCIILSKCFAIIINGIHQKGLLEWQTFGCFNKLRALECNLERKAKWVHQLPAIHSMHCSTVPRCSSLKVHLPLPLFEQADLWSMAKRLRAQQENMQTEQKEKKMRKNKNESVVVVNNLSISLETSMMVLVEWKRTNRTWSDQLAFPYIHEVPCTFVRTQRTSGNRQPMKRSEHWPFANAGHHAVIIDLSGKMAR